MNKATKIGFILLLLYFVGMFSWAPLTMLSNKVGMYGLAGLITKSGRIIYEPVVKAGGKGNFLLKLHFHNTVWWRAKISSCEFQETEPLESEGG